MLRRYFPIIDRYIAKELLLTWLAVTLVLMLILLSSTLARLLGKAADGTIPGDAVIPMLTITGTRYLILLIPLSLYLGVLLCFSRLYKDNEMAALGACGVGMKRLYRPLMMVVLPVSLFISLMTLQVMPLISQQGQILKGEIESRSELSGLVAGRFNQSSDGDAIMFLERQSDDRKNMENVFLHQQMKSAANIETANHARRYTDKDGRKFILFVNGQHYEGVPGRSNYRITQYEKHGIFVPETEAVHSITRRDAILTKDLIKSDSPLYRAELQWRLSIPIATLLMAILALPLSYTTPRKGRYSKLALAILIYLIYSNLMGVGQTWVEQRKVPDWIGMWWVHGFGGLLIIYWWIKRAGGIKQLWLKKGISKPA